MAGLIITGDLPSRTQYIDEYTRRFSIPSTHVLTFTAPVRMQDVHSILRYTTLKLRIDENRLILILSEINVESQNALLKCLEELPERMHIIISLESNVTLLSTVTSRCRTISLSSHQEKQPIDEALIQLISDYVSKGCTAQNLSLINIFMSQEAWNYSDLVMAMRKYLLANFSHYPVGVIKKLTWLLGELNKNNTLVQKNNLNQRLFLENIFLDAEHALRR